MNSTVDSVEFIEKLNERSHISFLIGAYMALDKNGNLSDSQKNRKKAFQNLIEKTDNRFITDYWMKLENIISEGPVKSEDWTGDYSHHPQVIKEYREKANWIYNYLSNDQAFEEMDNKPSLIEHEKKAADYEKLVAKYEKSYDQELTSILIDTYILLDKIQTGDLSYNESAMKDGLLRSIKNIKGDQLNEYKGDLVQGWSSANNEELKSVLEETIEWVDYYMCYDKPMPAKAKLPDIYDSGEKVYDLLKRYLNVERSKIELDHLSEWEEFELNKDIQYLKSSQRKGITRNKLVEEVVSQILLDNHEDFFEEVMHWDEFHGGFQQYALSKITERV